MNKKLEYSLLIILLSLSFLLHLPHVSDMQFATDEDFTLSFGHEINHGDYHNVSLDPSPPGYYFFIAFLQRVSSSITFLRLCTIFISLLSLVLFYFLSKKFFSEEKALLATLFLSLNPLFFIYSRHLRNYALLTLIFLISTYLLYLFLFEKKEKILGLLFFSYAVLFYVNFFSLFLIATHFFIFFYFLYTKRISFKKSYLFQSLFFVVPLLLWIPFFLKQFNRAVVQPGHIKLYPLQLQEIPYPFYKFALMINLHYLQTHFNYLFILFPLLSFFVVYGIFKLFKENFHLGIFSSLSLLGPPLLLLLLNPLIEHFTTDHYSLYYFRYFSYLVPIYVLLLMKGIFSLKSKPLRLILLALLFIAWITVIFFYLQFSTTYDWSAQIAV